MCIYQTADMANKNNRSLAATAFFDGQQASNICANNRLASNQFSVFIQYLTFGGSIVP